MWLQKYKSATQRCLIDNKRPVQKKPFIDLSAKRQNYGLRRRYQNIPVKKVFQ